MTRRKKAASQSTANASSEAASSAAATTAGTSSRSVVVELVTTGLVCPKCKSKKLKSLRTKAEAAAIHRDRECRNCGARVLCQEQVIGLIHPAKKKKNTAIDVPPTG